MPDLRNSISAEALAAALRDVDLGKVFARPSLLSLLPADFSTTTIVAPAKYGMSEYPLWIAAQVAMGAQIRPEQVEQSRAKVSS